MNRGVFETEKLVLRYYNSYMNRIQPIMIIKE